MEPIRITGLVRLQRDVRERLQRGIYPNEEQRIRDGVQQAVDDVESICQSCGTSPDMLPAPSRKAYYYLKGLDLERLPVRDLQRPVEEAQPRISIDNIQRICNFYSSRLWRDVDVLRSDAARRQQVRDEIRDDYLRIESLCHKQGKSPASLSQRSRDAYSWLLFLSTEARLDDHLSALARVQHILRTASLGIELAQVEVHLLNMRSLYRGKWVDGILQLQCGEGFIRADDNIWKALMIGMINRKARAWRNEVRLFAASADYASVMMELEFSVELHPGEACGRIHDLNDCFQRINHRYFDDQLEKPRLVWSMLPTRRKFGHYQMSRDTVLISRSLDHPEVPLFVVDFVMYHELLHKLLGAEIRGGRRYVHTAEFRRREKAFHHYSESVSWLDAFARWR